MTLFSLGGHMVQAAMTSAQVAGLLKTGVHRVDRSLYLQIQRGGGRSWLFRYQLNGRARSMGLGPVRLVSLAEARTKVIRAQRLILDGIDPLEARLKHAMQVTVPSLTFAECAHEYIEAHKVGWRNAKHAYQWTQSLETYANPVIGSLPVADVDAKAIVALLLPIWSTKSETAGRLRGRIERVLDWARARSLREGDNPARWAGSLSHLLPPLGKVQIKSHYDAVPYQQIPDLFKRLELFSGLSVGALRFLILTAARSGEVRGGRFNEIDRSTSTWTVPGVRMKTGKEHRVPLPRAAMGLIGVQEEDTALLFPGKKLNKSLSDMSLIQVMKKARGPRATVHGLRSSFRDWAAETTDFPREVVEACLAHQVGSAVELAYKRTDFFDKRRELMEKWAAYCLSAIGSRPAPAEPRHL